MPRKTKTPKEGWLKSPCMYVRWGVSCQRILSSYEFWDAEFPNIRVSLTTCAEHKDWGQAIVGCFTVLSDDQLREFIRMVYGKSTEELNREIRDAVDAEKS